MRQPSRVLWAGALLMSTSCVNFEQVERVLDVRVLGMRTEPAEVLFSPFFLTPPEQRPAFLPLPTTEVTTEFYAIDPRGGRITTTIQLCPEGVTDSTCRLYDPSDELATLPPAARDDVTAALAVRDGEATVSNDGQPVGRVLPATNTLSLTPSVIDFLQPKNAQGEPVPSVFPILPRIVVGVENNDAADAERNPDVVAERAFKRLPLVLDLTSNDLPADFRNNLASGLGLTLCNELLTPDTDYVLGDGNCLYGKVANLNPTLRGFRIESSATPDDLTKDMLYGDDVDLGLSSFATVNAGGLIALTPMFAEGALERYQVISFDIESSKIKLINRVEDMALEYFITRGSVSQASTALEFTRSLGSIWTTPGRCPDDADEGRQQRCVRAGERDTLVVIARDQRGGVTWADMTVEYR
jgi:hypothetical protein